MITLYHVITVVSTPKKGKRIEKGAGNRLQIGAGYNILRKAGKYGGVRRGVYMTAEYRVVTKHTKKVLEDFVKFTYRVNHPKTTFRLGLLAGCFVLLAMFLGDGSTGMWVCVAIAAVILLFAFFRHKIGLVKLMKQDDNYKKQSEIEFAFYQRGFAVSNPKEAEPIQYKYGEIAAGYKDDKNYYINVEEELFLLPYRDFELGSAKTFGEFICAKTGKDMVLIKLTWKEKIETFKNARNLLNEEHEKKKAGKK